MMVEWLNIMSNEEIKKLSKEEQERMTYYGLSDNIPYHRFLMRKLYSFLYAADLKVVPSIDQIVCHFELNENRIGFIHETLKTYCLDPIVYVKAGTGFNKHRYSYADKQGKSKILVKLETKDNVGEGIFIFNPNTILEASENMDDINSKELGVLNLIYACSQKFCFTSLDFALDIYDVNRNKIHFGLNDASPSYAGRVDWLTEYLFERGENHHFKIYPKADGVVRLEMTIFCSLKSVEDILKDYIDNFPTIYLSRFNPLPEFQNSKGTFWNRHKESILCGMEQDNPLQFLNNRMIPFTKTELKELEVAKRVSKAEYNRLIKLHETKEIYSNDKKITVSNTYSHSSGPRKRIIEEYWMGVCIEELKPNDEIIDAFRTLLVPWFEYFNYGIQVEARYVNYEFYAERIVIFEMSNSSESLEKEYEMFLEMEAQEKEYEERLFQEPADLAIEALDISCIYDFDGKDYEYSLLKMYEIRTVGDAVRKFKDYYPTVNSENIPSVQSLMVMLIRLLYFDFIKSNRSRRQRKPKAERQSEN